MFVSCTFSGAAWLLRMATLFPGPQIPPCQKSRRDVIHEILYYRYRYIDIDIDIDREIDRYVYIYI